MMNGNLLKEMPLLSTLVVSNAVNVNQHSHMSDFAEMSYFQPLHIWMDLSVPTYGLCIGSISIVKHTLGIYIW